MCVVHRYQHARAPPSSTRRPPLPLTQSRRSHCRSLVVVARSRSRSRSRRRCRFSPVATVTVLTSSFHQYFRRRLLTLYDRRPRPRPLCAITFVTTVGSRRSRTRSLPTTDAQSREYIETDLLSLCVGPEEKEKGEHMVDPGRDPLVISTVFFF